MRDHSNESFCHNCFRVGLQDGICSDAEIGSLGIGSSVSLLLSLMIVSLFLEHVRLT